MVLAARTEVEACNLPISPGGGAGEARSTGGGTGTAPTKATTSGTVHQEHGSMVGASMSHASAEHSSLHPSIIQPNLGCSMMGTGGRGDGWEVPLVYVIGRGIIISAQASIIEGFGAIIAVPQGQDGTDKGW